MVYTNKFNKNDFKSNHHKNGSKLLLFSAYLIFNSQLYQINKNSQWDINHDYIKQIKNTIV